MVVRSAGLAVGLCSPTLARQEGQVVRERWPSYAHRRLTGVFERALEVPFDRSSRFVFLSDCHRGDGSRADAFIRNQELFLHILGHYYEQGYIYVEVGDGDEMWKSWRFEDIRHTHEPVFDLLHRFDRQGRLHLILGNHDLRHGRQEVIDKDGIIAHEGLILRHTRTGQRLFVVHGHQVDFKSDYLGRISRLAVGYVWRRLQLLGLVEATSPMSYIWKLKRMERALMSWAEAHRQVVICGHTHRPKSAVHGQAPYFNAGSCVFPGCITGLELENDEIGLVSWCVRGSARPGRALRLERQVVAPPRKLCTLA